jgi:CRP/FNR family transcriptional regulator, cyclic AMP receptor protein
VASHSLEAPAESFLAHLTPAELEAFTGLAVRRRFPSGCTIFHQGDESGSIYVLVKGRARISCVGESGKLAVLGFPGPGDMLGELSVFDGRTRSATLTAIDNIEALAVASGDFRRFVDTHPRVALLIIETLVQRLRDADRQRLDFAMYDVTGRVARRLLQLAEEFGEPCSDGVRIGLKLSQDELAGWAGSSREAVSKSLHALRDLGWIRTERQRLTVLDMDALREFSA